MIGPHAWVTSAIGEYLIVVWLTAALAALIAAVVRPWGERLWRHLAIDAKAPGDSSRR